MEKAVLSGDKIFSNRVYVNVLYPHGRGPDNWNHHYAPVNRRRKGETIPDYLRAIVRETIWTERPGWADRVTEIVIREQSERGAYHWTAYGECLRFTVQGPTGTHKFTHEDKAHAYIRSQCIGWYHRPAEFCIIVNA